MKTDKTHQPLGLATAPCSATLEEIAIRRWRVLQRLLPLQLVSLLGLISPIFGYIGLAFMIAVLIAGLRWSAAQDAFHAAFAEAEIEQAKRDFVARFQKADDPVSPNDKLTDSRP